VSYGRNITPERKGPNRRKSEKKKKLGFASGGGSDQGNRGGGEREIKLGGALLPMFAPPDRNKHRKGKSPKRRAGKFYRRGYSDMGGFYKRHGKGPQKHRGNGKEPSSKKKENES